MVRCNMISRSQCILCRNNAENEFHLYFDCPYSTLVWKTILAFLSYNRVILPAEEEAEWILQHFTGSDAISYIKRLAFNATIYHIWQERNNRRFKNTFSPPNSISRLIIDSVKLKANFYSLQMTDSGRSRSFFESCSINCIFSRIAMLKCIWKKPNVGWFALNTDGSLTDQMGGLGGVIRDHNGDLIHAFAAGVTKAPIYVLELKAVAQGIKMTVELGIRKLRVHSDSKQAVEVINGKHEAPWEARDEVMICRHYMQGFEEIEVKHVFREINKPADLMAGWCNNIEYVNFDNGNFPEQLILLANQDAAGCNYYRII